MGSIRNRGISTFWAQKIAPKKSMKFVEISSFYDFSAKNK